MHRCGISRLPAVAPAALRKFPREGPPLPIAHSTGAIPLSLRSCPYRNRPLIRYHGGKYHTSCCIHLTRFLCYGIRTNRNHQPRRAKPFRSGPMRQGCPGRQPLRPSGGHRRPSRRGRSGTSLAGCTRHHQRHGADGRTSGGGIGPPVIGLRRRRCQAGPASAHPTGRESSSATRC